MVKLRFNFVPKLLWWHFLIIAISVMGCRQTELRTTWDGVDRFQSEPSYNEAPVSPQPANVKLTSSHSDSAVEQEDFSRTPSTLLGIEESTVESRPQSTLVSKPTFENFRRQSAVPKVASNISITSNFQEIQSNPYDSNHHVRSASASSFVSSVDHSFVEKLEQISQTESSNPAIPDYSQNIYDCTECQLTFRDDIKGFCCMLKDDTIGVINLNNMLLLGAAAGGAIAMRENADDRVRSYTAEYPRRWGDANDFFDAIGDVPVQVSAMAGLWGYSVWRQDQELHEFTKALTSAYTITGLTTVTIKAIADTERPSTTYSNGRHGFPSFHTSSSFSIASVIDEYYGHKIGIPAYAVAGMIGWSRIDSRAHDLSDVFFGAALGYVIGKSVSGRHLCCDSRVRILPWVSPIGSAGFCCEY